MPLPIYLGHRLAERLTEVRVPTLVLNAANEVGVAAFLDKQIRFDQIHQLNLATLETATISKPSTLEDLLALDAAARATAQAQIKRLI